MINPSMLPNLAGGLPSTTAAMDTDMVAELQKALTVGYGTDVSTLAGGAAFRIQSLDKTMMATIQENKHFKLFNELAKQPSGATVDEWTEMSQVGGFPGGSTNSEVGNIAQFTGTYNRRVGLVKYLMTQRQVSFVSTLGNNLVSSEAVEQMAGAKQLLTDAEFLSFDGDSTVVPTEFDGVYAQLKAGITASQVDPANIVDARAQSLASINLVNSLSAQVSAINNFGTPTHLFFSQLVQSDFDTNLDPAFRVALNGGGLDSMKLGSPVIGIRTSWGDIKTMADVFVKDQAQQAPFEVLYPAVATANASLAPVSVTADASATDTASQFTGSAVGLYYWFVCGLNAAGQSTGVLTTQTTVASGKRVTLTITRSAGAQETGYAIYRSRQGGTNAAADVRLITRIPVVGATTPFVDFNADIPGTTKAFMLNMTPGDSAITWRQLLPMLKFPLYPTVSAVIPWAQLLFGYLRISKRRHHGVIKNILPNGALWRPFG